MKKILLAIWSNISVDIVGLFRAQQKLHSKKKHLEENFEQEENSVLNDASIRASLDTVEKYISLERSRKNALDSKASSNLMGISISITLILAAVSILLTNYDSIRFKDNLVYLIFCTVFFVFAILYFSFAGYLSLNALYIRKEYYTDYSNNDTFETPGAKTAHLIICLKINQLRTTLISNLVYISHKCIRNGMILLIVIIFALMILMYIHPKESVITNSNVPSNGYSQMENKLFVTLCDCIYGYDCNYMDNMDFNKDGQINLLDLITYKYYLNCKRTDII